MKASGGSTADDSEKGPDEKGSAEENIDHILDNMFVQRPMTNVISLKEPAPSAFSSEDQNDDQIRANMNVRKNFILQSI